jgi:hypothetical protein
MLGIVAKSTVECLLCKFISLSVETGVNHTDFLETSTLKRSFEGHSEYSLGVNCISFYKREFLQDSLCPNTTIMNRVYKIISVCLSIYPSIHLSTNHLSSVFVSESQDSPVPEIIHQRIYINFCIYRLRPSPSL